MSRTGYAALIVVVLFVAVLLLTCDAEAAKYLTVQTWWNPLDGEAVRAPARINVSRSWMTDTCFVHVGSPAGPTRLYYNPNISGRLPWCYTGEAGEFIISVPDSLDSLAIDIRVARGFEAKPETTTVTWDKSTNATVRCTLDQYTDMADSLWVAFDPWMHTNEAGTYDAYAITRTDLRAVMLAEGLTAAAVHDASWDDDSFAFDGDEDTDFWNDDGLAVWFQQQVEDGVWGTVLPVACDSIPLVGGVTTAHKGAVCPGFFAESWYQRIAGLNGYSFLAGGHSVSVATDTVGANGAYETARDMVWSACNDTLDGPDCVLVCEGHGGPPIGDPDTEENHRTYADWRHLTAMGHNLALGAGSDCALNQWYSRAPAGGWRMYVTKPSTAPADWIPYSSALKHSYITSGPLIVDATLGDHSLGRMVPLKPGSTCTLSVRLQCPVEVDSLYVWLNGDVLSAVAFDAGETDTTYTEAITFYGGTDSYLWVDVVGGGGSWAADGDGTRQRAITNAWHVNIDNRSECYEQFAGEFCDAWADSIASHYTTLDAWPDKHTTKSSIDSLAFMVAKADVNARTEEKRYVWCRPSTRAPGAGTQSRSEFPYDNIKTALDAVSDTLYLYAGSHTYQSTASSAVDDGAVIRGFPECSRPSQVYFNIGAETNAFVTGVDGDAKFGWMCFRNATAIANETAIFDMSSESGALVFDNVWIKNFDLGDADNNGCFEFTSCSDLDIRHCWLDSIDGGGGVVADLTGCALRWYDTTVSNLTLHENASISLGSAATTDFINSLWAEIDGKNNLGAVASIVGPTGRVGFRGCTFDNCEIHKAAYQAFGNIVLFDAACDSLVVVSHCVFTNADSTRAVGVFSATELDSLVHSVAYDVASWPPAAADTTGLLNTDPHYNMARLDRKDAYRVTDTRCMELATTRTYMGWMKARPPIPTPSDLTTEFGSSSGGGGGTPDKPPRTGPESKLPPPQ